MTITWVIPEKMVQILYKSPQIYAAYQIAQRDSLNKESFLVLCVTLLYETLTTIERYQMHKLAFETPAQSVREIFPGKTCVCQKPNPAGNAAFVCMTCGGTIDNNPYVFGKNG